MLNYRNISKYIVGASSTHETSAIVEMEHSQALLWRSMGLLLLRAEAVVATACLVMKPREWLDID